MKISLPGILFFVGSFLLAGCDPEMGSDDWCEVLRDKTKVEWTAEEVKGFTNYCIGRDPLD